MKTAIACAVLALAAWLVYALIPGRDEAVIFAVVWTSMAVAYAPRVRRGSTST